MFLTGFTSHSVLLFPLSITFFTFMHSFYAVSSNIEEVLLISRSANMFAFGGFNVHHQDWLTCFGGTGRLGELSYNFCISIDLTHMVNFPTQIPDCYSQSPAFLVLFLSSDAIICSMAFPPLGNSNHMVVSVLIDFLSNSKWNILLHCIAYDYSCADWDGLCDHSRDVSWKDIFKIQCFCC